LSFGGRTHTPQIVLAFGVLHHHPIQPITAPLPIPWSRIVFASAIDGFGVWTRYLRGGLGMGVSVDDPAGIGMIPQASGILQANAPSLHAIENIADSMLQLNSIYY
jgi:hypothetical protein